MESKYDDNIDDKKLNKYISQIIQKIKFILIKSPSVYFDIDSRDLKEETISQIKDYTKDCKTTGESYRKLNGLFTEVIAKITKQAEPLVLSLNSGEDVTLFKVSLNQIRELVSSKWRFIY